MVPAPTLLRPPAPAGGAARQPLAAFVQHALRTPAAPALTGAGGAVGYGELLAMVADAAAQCRRLGLGRDARVAVVGPKSPETIALTLACLLTGRPVLLAPDAGPPSALHALAERAGVERVLAAEPRPGADVVRPARDATAAAPAPAPRAGEIALMLTTSGSTGSPKVVPIAADAIGRFAAWASARFDIGPGMRVLSYCGLHFDLSLLELWTTLMHGACAVLVDPRDAARPDRLLDLVRRHRVGVVQGVPTLAAMLLDAAAASGRSLPSVRHMILTGDAAPASVLARLPGPLANSRIYNVYGCTETNDSFIHEVDPRRELDGAPLPLGRPLPGVSALILRGGRALVGAGSGELWVRTPFQATGYLAPRSPDDGFAPQPATHPAHGHFRSGDLVRRDADGRVLLEGRTDAQVKVRGQRVNLQAVERVLLADPGVAAAAVVAVDDDLAGTRLHGVVRRRAGARVDTIALRASCVRELGRAAAPASIHVQDDPLPATATGKVDRGALRRDRQRGGT